MVQKQVMSQRLCPFIIPSIILHYILPFCIYHLYFIASCRIVLIAICPSLSQHALLYNTTLYIFFSCMSWPQWWWIDVIACLTRPFCLVLYCEELSQIISFHCIVLCHIVWCTIDPEIPIFVMFQFLILLNKFTVFQSQASIVWFKLLTVH